jgi:hypothetical protein
LEDHRYPVRGILDHPNQTMNAIHILPNGCFNPLFHTSIRSVSPTQNIDDQQATRAQGMRQIEQAFRVAIGSG